MPDKKLEILYSRLDQLTDKQLEIQSEISSIQKALEEAKNSQLSSKESVDLVLEQLEQLFSEAAEPINSGELVESTSDQETPESIEQPKENIKAWKSIDPFQTVDREVQATPQSSSNDTNSKNKSFSFSEIVDFERFIGENLLNKIGILILIIGVGIGVKYAIDNSLVSPLMRVISGYGVGIGLLVSAIRLKPKYHDFSAVLLSGAMAILYFMTFAAYDFYGLIPQLPAFALMALFTVFTVFAAIRYDRQVIAHIGLVGAYAVPFLLSSGGGSMTVFFTYIALLNLGILAVAFWRSWKPLFYSAFVITWGIFAVGVLGPKDMFFFDQMTFSTIFFLLFYGIFMAQKLVKKEKFAADDLLLILFNSFIYFGFGYFFLSEEFKSNEVLSFFTLGNALIHFAAASLIFTQRKDKKGLFRLVIGMGIAFLGIAIPVQLDANWVTLLWAIGATFLFWLSRKEEDWFYEVFSYALMVLSGLSLLDDWNSFYHIRKLDFTPILNIGFASNIVFAGLFAFMFYLIINKPYSKKKGGEAILSLRELFGFVVPAIALLVLFTSFYLEIGHYFDKLLADSKVLLGEDRRYTSNQYLRSFKFLWLFNYTLFFVGTASLINSYKFKSKNFGLICLVGILLCLLGLILCFPVLEGLRTQFLSEPRANQIYFPNNNYILIRYVCFAFVAYIVFALSKVVVDDKHLLIPRKRIWEYTVIGLMLTIASFELINITELLGYQNVHKMGLSILWGVCSLVLIGLGIFKNRKDFRIIAIVLFAFTLIKLFFYDLVELETIPKTIVFISIGILLLVISFLYNKFKDRLYNDI